jgi:predicted SprT family Zn-dependent metalloprotease
MKNFTGFFYPPKLLCSLIRHNTSDLILKGNTMQETQGTLDFPVSYETHTGSCTCGQEYSCNRISIAIEMTYRCPKCGKIIPIGKVNLRN